MTTTVSKEFKQQVTELLKQHVPTYAHKVTDYPAEFAKNSLNSTAKNACGELTEFGFYRSLVDRMQWQMFLRGIQMVQAGALLENQSVEV